MRVPMSLAGKKRDFKVPLQAPMSGARMRMRAAIATRMAFAMPPQSLLKPVLVRILRPVASSKSMLSVWKVTCLCLLCIPLSSFVYGLVHLSLPNHHTSGDHMCLGKGRLRLTIPLWGTLWGRAFPMFASAG